MTTPHLKNSMDRSPSRLGLLLIPVVFACFALTQSAQSFIHPRVGVVTPHSVKLEGFRGLAKSGNRKLEATKPGFVPAEFRLDEDTKEGKFSVQFHVTGPGLPGGSPLRIRVKYNPNVYKYADGKVTKLTPDPMPIVRCE